MTLIHAGEIIDDTYPLVADDAAIPASGSALIGWDRFEKEQDALGDSRSRIGLLLPNTLDVAANIDPLLAAPLLVLQFPGFADGRAYSQARLLRDRYGYQGDLRATGQAVVLDQIGELLRCGFSSLHLRADQDPQRCLAAFKAPSLRYQSASDSVPVVRFGRRAISG